METSKVVDRSSRRELNQGFGDALSTAVEMAVTPLLFAALGWWIDRALGTSPLLLIFLFAFTAGYVIWKYWVRYSADMDRELDIRRQDYATSRFRRPGYRSGRP